MFALYDDNGKITALKMQVAPKTPNAVRIKPDLVSQVLRSPSTYRVVAGVLEFTSIENASVGESLDLMDIDGMQFARNPKLHLRLLTALQVEGVKFHPLNLQESVTLTEAQIKTLLLEIL